MIINPKTLRDYLVFAEELRIQPKLRNPRPDDPLIVSGSNDNTVGMVKSSLTEILGAVSDAELVQSGLETGAIADESSAVDNAKDLTGLIDPGDSCNRDDTIANASLGLTLQENGDGTFSWVISTSPDSHGMNHLSPATPITQPNPSRDYDMSQIFQDLIEGPEMVVLPSGSFWMGSEKDSAHHFGDERPLHQVCIGYQFALGKYPVTFAEWDACVASGGVSHMPEDEGWGREKRPVINVSWNDAQDYAAWLNRKLGISLDDPCRYRLPSEAELEYACRAGTTAFYNTPGGKLSPNDATYDASERDSSDLSPEAGKKHDRTTPVGIYAPNPWGLYDMHGNVWVWAQDRYEESYRGAPMDGSAWEAASGSGSCWTNINYEARVLRGGCWGNSAHGLRSARRYASPPFVRLNNIGFRLAKTLPNSDN